jgi:hypothetical protein
MILRPMLVCAIAALAVVSVVLSGCGGGTGGATLGSAGGSDVQPMALVNLPLTNANAAASGYRWGDIAGNLYNSNFSGAFTYSTPTVTVSFDDMGGTTLSGTLSASGLKPNFAYQIKLEGKPTADAWGNERIGYLGRWWSPVAGNVDDAYYVAHKSTEAILGYLLFDFFITDGNGNAMKTFRVDSSYHVLWNVAQPGAPLSSAGPSQQGTPVWTAGAYGSSEGFIATTQTLFPEIQSGRPLPDKALLPTGSYNCALVITEESFHNHYAGGGNWAAAMRHDALSFTVVVPGVHDLAITGITTAASISANRSTTVGVTVVNKGNVVEPSAQVSLTDVTTGQLVGALSVSNLAAGKSTTVSLTWRPTIKGYHTLQAAAAQVASETNLANNTLTKVARVK